MSNRPLRVVPGDETEESSERPAPLDFDAFFATESQELFRRLWLVTRNRAEAEEVMQDAFLSLYERWDRMATIDDPKAYLYRTAFNAWNKRSRRTARAMRVVLTQPARGDDVDAVSHHVLDKGQCCLTRMQVMNVDGSGLHVVVRDAEEAKWSPNGDRIVYQVMSDDSNVPSQVWTTSPDGSDQIKVFDADGCEMGNDPRPVWAPDGRRVAFDGCGFGKWVVANADGKGTPQPIDELVWRSWYSGGLTGSDLARMGSGIQFP